MIGDNHLDLGSRQRYHRQAVAELAELRNEVHALRTELGNVRNDRDTWAQAYEALRQEHNG